ncbi:MAG: nucleoside phosphorylase [Candidatus Thermoplasmatota archaeon]|jgi:uridine phosphorylase|nr:nucleoside phosphorylase [Candidatus Thermoplasmatota archaeon]
MTFPNFSGKHDKAALYGPRDYIEYQRTGNKYLEFEVPQGVIICYQNSLWKYIVNKQKTTRLKGFFGDIRLLDGTGGKVVVIGKFGIGAPVAVALLEELIAFGVTNFISIGSAGTLQKEIEIGDIVVCDKAIRDEGTSYHYLEGAKHAHASKKITKEIMESLDRCKVKYHVGTSWTTDAPYRETLAEIRKYQSEGVATVEMEAAALFAVAEYRKVDMGSFFTISDSLAELEWKPEFHGETAKKSLETIFKVAVEVLMGE